MNIKNWDTFAGGCFAASDRYNYMAVTEIGRYFINPVSSKNNVEQHLGYKIAFANERGMLPGGLWSDLAKSLQTLPAARRLCNEHYGKHHKAAPLPLEYRMELV